MRSGFFPGAAMCGFFLLPSACSAWTTMRVKCKAPRKAMMFVSGPLKVALATIHEGLFDVRHKFTIGCVFEPIDLLNEALREFFGLDHPRIGVAALNPHAGENGQFGDEERRIIAPAKFAWSKMPPCRIAFFRFAPLRSAPLRSLYPA